MKILKILGLYALIFFATGISADLNAQSNCYVIVPLSQNVIDGSAIPPGSIICVEAGNRDYLLIRNMTGNLGSPIIIKNFNGAVVIQTTHYYGIKLSNCSNVVLSGSGVAGIHYGFNITGVSNGVGITIDDLSTHTEVNHVKISNTKFSGIIAKTDPSCTNFSATREKFTMYDLKINNCYLHDIGDEGFYIGSSKYTGQYLPSCDTTVLPHLIEGVYIHDNIIERTGWDGLQVSSSSKNCFVHNNRISFDSQRETQDQMSGIIIGGGSQCDCYNNIVLDGKGDGIDYFGSGNQKIYNNLIVRPGKSFQPANPNLMKHGIYIGNAVDQMMTSLQLVHNTIVAPKSTGIRFVNAGSMQNKIYNNIITEPGSFSTMGESAYFLHNLASSQYEFSHNLLNNSIEVNQFINYQSDNYELKPGSPAVNAAKPGIIVFDLNNNPRPHNLLPDIGAFESQDPFASTEELGTNKIDINAFPNPSSGIVYLILPDGKAQKFQFHLTDVNGLMLLNGQLMTESENKYQKLDLSALKPGIYFLKLFDNVTYSTHKIILTH